jgi:enoyl-CoA hydratase/carnithine racemase
MISRFTKRAMSTVANVQPSLLTSISNNVASITLNRSKVLNSLNVDMCSEMKNLLIDWRTTSDSDLKTKSIGAFVMSGSGGKAFCAGGDVKSVYNELVSMRSAGHGNEIGTGKKGSVSNDFFRLEYEMNYLLGTSPIPQVSIWNGIVMGGGVGISVLGEFRIATEKTMFAMPETAIGLFPDVGSSAWLPHLQGGQGLYIGLTGVRLNASDLLYTGIATHFLPSIELEKVEKEIISTCSSDPKVARDQIKKILLSACEECKPDSIKSVIEPNKDAINRCFGNATSAEGIK